MFRLAFVASFAMLLVACGGGGDGSGTSSSGGTTSRTLVTGTVSQGAAIAGATVTLKDSTGTSITAVTAADGTYSLDVSALSPPFVAMVVSAASGGGGQSTLVSCEDVITDSATNVINVTPWTTGICAMLSSTGRAKDLDPIKDKSKILSSLTTVDNYTKTLLAPSLIDAGYAATQGPIGTAFVADHTGYDSIYDNLTVGTTPSNAVFMTDNTSPPCSANQITNCVQYSDPAAQTTTDPNICGSDIASGNPIPCDSGIPSTTAPPANTISLSDNPYTFGCIGCIYWGPADNFSGTSGQTPLRLSHVVPLNGSSSSSGGSSSSSGSSSGGSSSGYYYSNYNCNGDSQCAADFGHNMGSAGPFCGLPSCQAWLTQNFAGGSCTISPKYAITNQSPPPCT